MLSLEEIENQYPENLKPFKRSILREYLQYKILEIIFNSSYATKLSFLGGTALRIVYGNTRFSEDLDFDNFGLTDNEFIEVADTVKKGLEAYGLEVEMKTVFKGACRANIRLPKILFDNGLTGQKEEKVLIQIDSATHHFQYIPDKKILNKFDVFSEIFVTPADIILSQKIYAAFERKRAKGRDFFDIVFLLSFARPNYKYLDEKISVSNASELRKYFIKETKDLDFQSLGRDVKNFLFNPTDVKKVELFREFIKDEEL